MVGDHFADYLAGLPPEQAAALAKVNGPGIAALRRYLDSGEAVAFLGAGVSAGLYPMWRGLIGDLVDAAGARLDPAEAESCKALADGSPEEAVEIIRQRLGVASYREALRQALRARVDPDTGRSWTPVQELICRCAFKAVVTTNYDPGILDARSRVRPGALATGFTTWEDELGLDQWRTGDVFGESELPVLFAHGLHYRPDSVVLATTEYRRAYAGAAPGAGPADGRAPDLDRLQFRGPADRRHPAADRRPHRHHDRPGRCAPPRCGDVLGPGRQEQRPRRTGPPGGDRLRRPGRALPGARR